MRLQKAWVAMHRGLCTKCHGSESCSNVEKVSKDLSDFDENSDNPDEIEQPSIIFNSENLAMEKFLEEFDEETIEDNEEVTYFDEQLIDDDQPNLQLAKRQKLV